MVEVTKKNFEQLLPEIEDRIRTCNFICVDAEYTGLYAEDFTDSNSLFDTPAKRYSKLRNHVASKYAICQIGLAFFEKDRGDKDMTDVQNHNVNAYNFYVFPVQFDTFAKRELLHMQVSCLNFLKQNDFDFNKFIKEGIPYLNREKATNLQKFLKVNRHVLKTMEHVDKDYFPTIKEYLTDADITAMVSRLEGFSKVITMIHNSKKPLVGHNLLMDLILIYKQFCGELPESYPEFKNVLHETFPVVFDTKCVAYGIGTLRMANNPEERTLSDTNLFTLYRNCSSMLMNSLKPIIMPMNETKIAYHAALQRGLVDNLNCVSDTKCHTAGFDATVTGGVFLKLGYLASRAQDVPEYRQGFPPTMAEIFKRLSIWKDEVNIARCIVPNIHLSKPDPESKRPDWIRVKSKVGETTVDPLMLKNLLTKFGDIEIEMLKPDEAIIACSGYACARNVWKTLLIKGFRVSKQKVPSLSPDILSRVLKCSVPLAIIGAFIMYGKRWYN